MSLLLENTLIITPCTLYNNHNFPFHHFVLAQASKRVLHKRGQHTHIPGGRSQGGDECLQQPTYENEGVLPRDQEVQCWQDDDGVDEQPTNHCNCVHSQLAAHGCDVVHLHDLTSNQEQDTNRGIPED